MTYFIYLVLIPLAVGFGLDLLFADPLGRYHPVVGIGRIVSACESRLCRKGRQERLAGVLTVLITVTVSTALPTAVLWIVYAALGRWAASAAASILCWQMLAAGSLRKESMKVFAALTAGSLEDARYAVSMIVGRETAYLDRDGVTRAAVETVAENTTDGVTAPAFWMAVLGVPGLYFYKAVNTMDSMIGYRSERYLLFGRTAARLDDVLNFLPARLTGLCMAAAAFLLPGLDGRNAFRIFRRDRQQSASPNAGCTEAAAAGALHIRLLGPAVYGGVLHDKPWIGDDDRPVEAEDIPRTCRLMQWTAALAIALLIAVMGTICIFFL